MRQTWIFGSALALVVVCSLMLVAMVPPAVAATAWWPDSNDVASDARATWVYFSNDYNSAFSTNQLVDAAVLEMRNKKVDIIIASLTTTDINSLSVAGSPRTVQYQRMVDQAAQYGMVVYTGYWEDEFNGASGQLSSYTQVSHVLDFNSNNGSQSDIVGVVTDYEMHSTNRTPTRYDQWRQFHANLKSAAGSLKVVPVLNDPTVLINNCSQCNSSWRTANGISGSHPNFSGDVAYFTSYNGQRTMDAVMPMYYYNSPAAIQSAAHDDIVEANALSPTASIIVAFSVGPNFDSTLLNEADVNTAISNNEAERGTYPNGTVGVMAWRWDDPTDGDAEYRGVISSQPPSGGGTATFTPTTGPSPTPSPTATRTPTPSGSSTAIHIADIYTSDVNGNPLTTFQQGNPIYWRVQIVDGTGGPVSGAAVTSRIVKPNGSVWNTQTLNTGADGWVQFQKGTLRNSAAGTYTVDVTNVVKAGLTYDSAANVRTSNTCSLVP